MAKAPSLPLGSRIAPPRFLMFCGVLAIGLATLIPLLGMARGAMAAFDIAAALFLGSLAPLLGHDTKTMRKNARDNDANRVLLLAISVVVTLVILVAVASELHSKASTATIALVIGTLVIAWLFSNTIYVLHYAHLFYLGDERGKDRGGITFPDCPAPDYWDFIYFSFTLGMTFQTSDVEIGSSRIRRVVIGHCLAAFVFNIGVLAFTINVIGGG